MPNSRIGRQLSSSVGRAPEGRFTNLGKKRRPGPLPFSPKKCCKVIVATAYLHNFAWRANLPDPEPVDVENFVENENVPEAQCTGFDVRQTLIDRFFNENR